MTYQSLDYLDETMREIKKGIVFFVKARFVNKEVIYSELSEDFKVPKIAIVELVGEIARERQQVVNQALEGE